jgi:predicted amidohydrolase YtcJ
MTNRRQTRREFLGLTGAGLTYMAGPGLLKPLMAQSNESDLRLGDTDLVVHNAKVYTIDRRLPVAEAFAIQNGRFSAVGNSADMRALAGKKTRVMDAAQMTIVPGFIDTHNHGGGEVLLYEVLCGNPYEVEFVTIDSIIEKMKARAMVTPPGYWVVGYFFDDMKVRDGRTLQVEDLDKVFYAAPRRGTAPRRTFNFLQ